MPASVLRSVLFDLDGTLADTAADLAPALNRVRQEQGLPPLPADDIRCEVSNGAGALIKLGFGLEPQHPQFETLRLRLLEVYQHNLATHTRLFDGIPELLDSLEQRHISWGVVTNKPKRFTEPLLDALDLTSRAACIISGDSLENKKPHPQPIYHACDMVDCQPQQCVYIGDAERDIQAGRNAGTFTLVALFGYIHNQQQPHTWGADHMVQSPEEILPWIDKLNSQSSSTETNSYAGQN